MKIGFLFVFFYSTFGLAATVSDFNQSALPKSSKVILTSAAADLCQISVFLHGHLVKNFHQDVMVDLRMERMADTHPGGILVVPNLMSKCRNGCTSAAHYDNFNFAGYLKKIVDHLQTKGLCTNGIEKIHLVGHSAAYYFVKYRIMDQLIQRDCRRPDTLLGKVENVVLLDALYYGARNTVMKNAYQGFANTLQRCNTNLRFAHLTRKMRGYRPHINSCDIDCRFLSEPSLDRPVQMIEVNQSYNDYRGHWRLVKDTLPVWFSLFSAG